MDRTMADKIIRIQIDEQKLKTDKFCVMRELKVISWEDATTEAMKFLLVGKHEKK